MYPFGPRDVGTCLPPEGENVETTTQREASSVRRRRFQFGLRTLFLATTAAALLLGIVVTPALVAWRKKIAQATCKENLQQISAGLNAYHASKGSFPPAYDADGQGRAIHSWRVKLGPYLQSSEWYSKYDWREPWDGPNNVVLHTVSMNVYSCPADRRSGATMTSYVAVVGQGTAWPENKTTRMRDFHDGTVNTLLLVEVADSGIHWMEPRDIKFEEFDNTINGPSKRGMSSHHEQGAHVLNAYGDAALFRTTLSPNKLRNMLTIDAGDFHGIP